MSASSSSRIPSLDGLRALSIIVVIVGHTWDAPGTAVLMSAFGVHTFFVLSGYLITGLLQKEHAEEGRINLLAFYKRRCFRIFPAAFTYIFVIALISPASRSALIYAVTYTTSYHPIDIPLLFQHLWSLSVEEQFYLLWPLALLLGFRRRAWTAWGAMVVAGLFRLWIVCHPSYSIDYLHFSFFGTMDSIAAGCLLAIYEPRLHRHCQWMAQHSAIAVALPLTAWIVEGAFWDKLSVLWGVVPLLVAFWVFLVVERRDWILNNPVASSIGVLSYSLYLWQQPFTLELNLALPLRLVMLFASAAASYFLIEKPMLKFGLWLRLRRPIPGHLPDKVRLSTTE